MQETERKAQAITHLLHRPFVCFSPPCSVCELFQLRVGESDVHLNMHKLPQIDKKHHTFAAWPLLCQKVTDTSFLFLDRQRKRDLSTHSSHSFARSDWCNNSRLNSYSAWHRLTDHNNTHLRNGDAESVRQVPFKLSSTHQTFGCDSEGHTRVSGCWSGDTHTIVTKLRVVRVCTFKSECVGLARTIYIRCIYGILGREITKYTVIYGACIPFWPTLWVWGVWSKSFQ